MLANMYNGKLRGMRITWHPLPYVVSFKSQIQHEPHTANTAYAAPYSHTAQLVGCCWTATYPEVGQGAIASVMQNMLAEQWSKVLGQMKLQCHSVPLDVIFNEAAAPASSILMKTPRPFRNVSWPFEEIEATNGIIPGC